MLNLNMMYVCRHVLSFNVFMHQRFPLHLEDTS